MINKYERIRLYHLSIQTSISAAHFLRNYRGACERMHGHNWKIETVVESDKLDEADMVIDFKDLHDFTWQVVGKFDHRVFNETQPFDKLNPTAENMSRYFYHEINKLLPRGIKVAKVKLWETNKYCIEYAE